MAFRLLVGGLLLLVILAGGELYLAQGGLSGPVRDMLVDRLSTTLGTEVAVERVRLSMFPPSVTARGVALGKVPPAFEGGTVGELRVRVSPWSLLTGGLGALDVRARDPDLAFAPPVAAADSGGAGVTLPLEAWEVYGAHRVRVDSGRVTVRRGDTVVVAEDIHLKGAPDVTLRRYALELSGGRVTVGGEEMLSGTSATLSLEPERVRVRQAAFESDAGRLELSGEVRLKGEDADAEAGPYVTLRTVYEGTAAGAVALAGRLGAPAVALSGRIGAEGRLYGTPPKLAWDGEVTGSDLGLGGDPRRVEDLEARLRVGGGRLEVVHVRARAVGGEVRGDGGVDLKPPHDYEGQLRADDVPMAWITGRDLALGRISGEARLVGAEGGRPRGTFQWLYRDGPDAGAGPGALPDDQGAPLLNRLAVRVVAGSGTGRLEADGTQAHEFTVETAGTRLDADVTVAPDHALGGTVDATARDFAEIGALFGLDYVHGLAGVHGRVSGTLPAYRLEARVDLGDGSVRALKVARLVGDVVLEPGRLGFRGVRVGGDGALRLAGELGLPPLGGSHEQLSTTLVASVHSVPLSELVGLVHKGDPLDLDLPVSGKLNLVRRPDVLHVWSHVHAGAGTLYDQPVASAEAGMWIDHDGLTLADAVFRLPVPGTSDPVLVADVLGPAEPPGAVVTGDGTLAWDGLRYAVTARTDSLPIQAVQRVAGAVQFIGGRFAGTGHLTGDFEDPDLRLDGTVQETSFHGDRVGQASVHLALSRWQLRVRGTLLAPVGREGSARFVLYTHLLAPNRFHVATRFTGTDARPWVRGLMPALDDLAASELGADWDLTASGSLAAAGSFRDGPETLLLKAANGRLTTGGRSARLEAPARVTLRGGRVTLGSVALGGEGLRLYVDGTLEPKRRFDLKVRGEAGAGWLAHVRPQYGFSAGAAAFDLAVAGPWDTPGVSGTVTPRGLAVAPPALEAEAVSFALTGEIAVDGPLQAPASGDLSARLAPFTLTVRTNTLSAAEARLTAAAGAFRLVPMELTGELGQVRVTGGWTQGERVDLKAVGNADLAVLVLQVPGLSQGEGRAVVSGEVSGPWDAPFLRAGATMEGARVHIDALEQTLEVASASLLYTGGRFVLDTLEGSLGGGTVVAEGSFDQPEGTIRAAASLDGYTMRPVTGLTAVVDGELLLSGALPAPTLSGDLRVRQAVYDKRMQWGAMMMDNVAGGGAEVARDVPFGETRLAVRVYGSDDIRVDTNIANLTLDMDLAVGGTVAEPGLAGRIDVRGGEVDFRGQTFTIVAGAVDFLHPDRIDPYLDVLARTTVEHALPDDPLRTEPIEIDMTLNGPVDHLDLTLTSRPDLPQADLLSLLAVGRTADELAQGGSATGAGEAAYLATGPLQSQLEEQLHRYAGIDRFQVEPFYAESTSTSGSARLTVGKKLLDGRGQVIYSTTMDAAQQPLIQLTYRLSPRTSVLLEQDEEGRAGGELRFRFRFR